MHSLAFEETDVFKKKKSSIEGRWVNQQRTFLGSSNSVISRLNIAEHEPQIPVSRS